MLAPAKRVDSRCRMAMRLIYAVLAVLAAAGRTTENDRRTIEGVRGILDIGIMEKNAILIASVGPKMFL